MRECGVNVIHNSPRRCYMSLTIQVRSQLYHFKSRILALVAAQVFSVVMVSRLFGISRKTFYKYRHEAEQGRLASNLAKTSFPPVRKYPTVFRNSGEGMLRRVDEFEEPQLLH